MKKIITPQNAIMNYKEVIFAHSRLPREKINSWIKICERLPRYRSFAKAYTEIEKLSVGMKGIGPLTVYDTSVYLGYSPRGVYLHCGTSMGYRNFCLHLGVTPLKGKKIIPRKDLPSVCRNVDFGSLEDLFCLYKKNPSGLEKILKGKITGNKCSVKTKCSKKSPRIFN